MKLIKIVLQNAILLSSAAFVITFGTLQTDAQVMPASKVATINADKFADPKIGIARIRKAIATLEREFAPLQTELSQMASQLQKLQAELNNPNADPAVRNKKYEEAEKLRREITYKQEDAKGRFESRQRILVEPLYAAVMTGLETYAKTRGIDMVIDMSKSGNILLINGALDISDAFIADYNSKNPATQ